MLVEEVDIYLVKVVIVVITKISSDKDPTHTFFFHKSDRYKKMK